MRKIKLKLRHGRGYKWYHLCYVPRELYEQYEEVTGLNIYHSIELWIRVDFNMTVHVQKDVEELKKLVFAEFADSYPELAKYNIVDPRAWVRLWIINNMKDEIQEYEQD